MYGTAIGWNAMDHEQVSESGGSRGGWGSSDFGGSRGGWGLNILILTHSLFPIKTVLSEVILFIYKFNSIKIHYKENYCH